MSKDLKDDMNELRSDVKEVKEDISEIKTHLAVYNEQLKIHIEGVKTLKELIVLEEKKLNDRLQPIEDHVKTVSVSGKLVLKVCGAIAAIAAFLLVLKELGVF